MDGLTTGRIVHYVLTQQDADAINARLAGMGNKFANERQVDGNAAYAGQHCPAMIVRLFDPNGGNDGMANLQVFLDGDFSHWATSRLYRDDGGHGSWHWIEKA